MKLQEVGMHARAATVGLLLALCACTRTEDLAPGTIVTCSSTAECPENRICNRGRCADPSAIDTTPPDLAAVVTVSPARVRAGQPFTVELELTEPLATAPKVSLALVPPVTLACAPRSTLRWACTYSPTGAENGGVGGDVFLGIIMEDLAGNVTARSSVAAATLDFSAPSPKLAAVAFEPAQSNPLASVRRATAGTRVRVVVSADEPLASAGRALTGRLGDATLAFTPAADPGLGVDDAAFVATLSGLEPDGAYTLAVTWSDALGNTATVPVPALVDVKTSRPTLVVDQDALVFVRSPWGNPAPEDLGGHVIPAGPYFALEPSDALTSAQTLPAGSLLLGDGLVPSAVIVRSDPTQTAQVLGVLRADAGARFPRQPLVSPDLSTVWLVGVDDAGNSSPAVKVRDAEWVATPTRPSFGANPHDLLAVGYVAPTRAQASARGAAPSASAAVVASATGEWRNRTWNGLDPGTRSGPAMAYDSGRGRVTLLGAGGMDTWEWDGTSWRQAASAGLGALSGGHAMAYDSARGRVVVFGGTTYGGTLQETWEWDGSSWTNVATTGPAPRSGHAMAYDSARGRIVLFGGRSGTLQQDTWEWDGATWTRVATTGPTARSGHGMAYDWARGKVVLFGGDTGGPTGLQDTWEWDGVSWTSVATAGPSARFGHAMAYDGARGRVVVFGGAGNRGFIGISGILADTWEWDGATWRQVSATGPAARYAHAMAYDVARRRVVMFGGASSIRDPVPGGTWEWDGARWSQVATAGPSGRVSHAMAEDAARGGVIVFGGDGPLPAGIQQDTWSWDGTSWTSVAGVGPARERHALAYDAARGRVVRFGGYAPTGNGRELTQDTAAWDGVSWTSVATTGPSARGSHAMAYDSARGRLVLFGGYDPTARQDTWEWNGSAWLQAASTGPSARGTHAMAYDGARRRVVLFGGAGNGDTWEWDGASWTLVAVTGPSPRSSPRMAYDGARGRVILFGGEDPALLADTWEWDGASWTSVATTGPTGRSDHAMAYDGARSRVVLFGGFSPDFSQETWEWTDELGHRPAVQFDAAAWVNGVGVPRWTRVQVRAHAGGAFAGGGSSDVGAQLWGWARRGAANEPGAWLPLDGAVNLAGVPSTGRVSGTTGSLISWRSTAAEALRFLVERDGMMSFQVRPRGGTGSKTATTRAAIDDIELRIRYTAP